MIDPACGQAKAKTIWGQLIERWILYIPFVIALGFFFCCLVIEILHVEISKESRDQIYSIFGTSSFYFSILLNIVYGRKFNLGWIRSLIFSLASFFLIFNLASQAWAKVDIWIFGGGAIASFRSLVFMPLLCLLLARFCQVDTLNLCDFLTPYFLFHHGFVTIPCWIEGCCAGRPWSWGLHNPLSGMTVFPTQPCIIILSLAVVFWGLHYSKKHAYKTNGMVFANSLCLYGVGRYVIELFSDDARIWWELSWLSLCSLIMVVLGLVIRYISVKRYITPA